MAIHGQAPRGVLRRPLAGRNGADGQSVNLALHFGLQHAENEATSVERIQPLESRRDDQDGEMPSAGRGSSVAGVLPRLVLDLNADGREVVFHLAFNGGLGGL